jgi:hypothetical protein
VAFLPTRALALLDALHAARPRHTLVAADFDALPDVRVPGLGAPLVSGRAGPGVPRDYDSVLVPWGSADIFFPTGQRGRGGGAGGGKGCIRGWGLGPTPRPTKAALPPKTSSPGPPPATPTPRF